jgi:hypothetical protein
MMPGHTRQEAKALGLPTCYGSVCKKHPQLEGLRRVSGACAECAKEILRRSRRSNPERTKAQARKDAEKARQKPELIAKKRASDAEYRKNNREKFLAGIAAWSKKNPEKVKQYAKKTKEKNRGRVNSDTVARRLAKIRRTPAWLTEDDKWLLKEAYNLAVLRTKMFGFPWHVDHIIPLQGEMVSGLHVPNNIQVIPWIDNVRKANSFEVI